MAGQPKAWAWEQNIPTGPKFVLVTLVTFADYDGTTAIGQAALTKLTGIRRTAIYGHLNELEQRGLISRTRRRNDDGTWNQDVFQILADGPVSDSAHGPVSDSARTSILDLKSSSEGSKNTPPIVPHGGRNGVVVLKPPAPEPEPEKAEPVTPEVLMEGWNEIVAPAGPSKCSALSATRRRKCLLRIKEHPELDFWEIVMTKISDSTFLRGLSQPTKEHPKPFRANFDWLIDNDVNAMKIHEGRYS